MFFLFFISLILVFKTSNSQISPDLPYYDFGFRSFPSDPTDFNQWWTYIIYIGIVFAIPLVVGLVMAILMCIGMVVLRFIEMIYKKVLYILCLLSYVLSFCVLLLLTGVAFVFLIISTISLESIKTNGIAIIVDLFDFGHTIGPSLSKISQSGGDISNAVANPLRVQMDELNEPLYEIEYVTNSSKGHYYNSQRDIDSGNLIFGDIQTKLALFNSMGMGNYDGINEYSFPPNDEILPQETINIIESGEANLNALKSSIRHGKSQVNFTMISALLNSSLHQYEDVVQMGVAGFVNGLNSVLGGVNGSLIRDVAAFSPFVTVGGLVIAAFIFFIFSIVFAVGLFFMFNEKVAGNCFYCLAGCSLCGVLIYTILSPLLISLFFFSSDACMQGEYALSRSSNPSYDFNISLGSTVKTLNYVNITLNLIHCGDGDVQTYFEASGLTLDQLNVSTVFEPIVNDLLNNMGSFNVSQYEIELNNIFGNVSNMLGLIPYNYTRQSQRLYDYFDREININFPLFLESLGYYSDNETTAYEELNTIIFNSCSINYNIQRDNITTFDIAISPWDVCTFVPPDDTHVMNDLKPLLEGFKTIIESYDVQLARDNITETYALLETLNNTMSNVTYFIGELKDAPDEVSLLLDEAEFLYLLLMKNMSNLVNLISDALNNEIRDIDALRCDSVGNFYDSLTQQGCGDVMFSTGIIGLAAAGMGIVMFIMFWFLVFSGSCIKEKMKKEKYGDKDKRDSGYHSSGSSKGSRSGSGSDRRSGSGSGSGTGSDFSDHSGSGSGSGSDSY